MMDVLTAFIDLVFPAKCTFCESMDDVDNRTNICTKCNKKLPYYREEYRYLKGGALPGCRGFKKFEKVYCLFEYTGIVKKTFVKYKFRGDVNACKAFAVLMHGMLEFENAYKDLDFITSVPLSGKKLAQRGFNQSRLLAKRISKLSNIPYEEVLARPVQGQTQSKLTEKERLGMKDRFVVINEHRGIGKNILVVDDILTTGSTLDEVSSLLLDKGANKLTAAIFASGRKDL